MKKNFKRIISVFLTILTLVSVLSISTTAFAAKTYDPAKLVETAEKYVGKTWADKSCLNFVANMVQKAYSTKYNSKPCAYEYGKKYLDSKDINSIPIGADVFFTGSTTECKTCKNTCGHIGIYIGDGYMIHTWAGVVKKDKVSTIANKKNYDFYGWGWHGDMTFASSESASTSSSSATVKTPLKTGTWYRVTNSKSGKLLNVYGSKSASNTNVTIYKKDNTSGQDFKLVANGTKSFGGKTYTKYIIVARCASKCALNVYGSSAKNNSNVNIWTKTGNNTQDWIFVPTGNGYVIRSANNTNYVLTASGTSNSSNVKLATYSSGNTYQIWSLA